MAAPDDEPVALPEAEAETLADSMRSLDGTGYTLALSGASVATLVNVDVRNEVGCESLGEEVGCGLTTIVDERSEPSEEP